MLSPQLLALLRDWWPSPARRSGSTGQNPVALRNTRQLDRAFHVAAQQAGIAER